MKKIVSAVIAITLLAMLSACGNKSPEQSNTEGGNPSGVTESVPISSENANMNTENIPQELQPIPEYSGLREHPVRVVRATRSVLREPPFPVVRATRIIELRTVVFCTNLL